MIKNKLSSVILYANSEYCTYFAYKLTFDNQNREILLISPYFLNRCTSLTFTYKTKRVHGPVSRFHIVTLTTIRKTSKREKADWGREYNS
jgi:hypothetical protein